MTLTAPANAALILASAGPLPVRAEFSSVTDKQVLVVSGSAWAVDEDVRLEIQVLVDGGIVGSGRLFSNGPSTHRALVFPAIPLSLAPGRHTIELRAGNENTITDGEDLLEATLIDR